MIEKLKKFYEDIIGFNNYIEFRMFNNEKGYFISHYASNFDEAVKIIKQFSSKRWNIYYGINTRKVKGRRFEDFDEMNVISFDIEHSGEKPKLDDIQYSLKLKKTTEYLIKNLENDFKIKPSYVGESGRGYHLLYAIKPIDIKVYKLHYRKWMRDIYDKYDYFDLNDDSNKTQKPYEDIKISDSVFNVSRILGAVGSQHTKYPELPARRILYMDVDAKKTNDIEPYLKEIKIIKPREITVEDRIEIADSYTEDTIYKSPEFQLLKHYDNLPEGNLHTSIIFSLKLLMKINNLTNQEEMSTELEDLGYEKKDMYVPESEFNEYQYTQRTLVNWVLNNYEWAVDNNYSCPYIIYPKKKFKYDRMKVTDKHEELEVYMNRKIIHPKELIEYIRDFNDDTKVAEHNMNIGMSKNEIAPFRVESLKKHIINSCENEKLIKFIFEMKHASGRLKKDGTYEKSTLFDSLKYYVNSNSNGSQVD